MRQTSVKVADTDPATPRRELFLTGRPGRRNECNEVTADRCQAAAITIPRRHALGSTTAHGPLQLQQHLDSTRRQRSASARIVRRLSEPHGKRRQVTLYSPFLKIDHRCNSDRVVHTYRPRLSRALRGRHPMTPRKLRN